MHLVICEVKKLINAFSEIKKEVEAGKVINLSWEVAQETKTRKQLGFMFGLIAKSIQRSLEEATGEVYKTDGIKELLYKECGKTELLTFNGNHYVWHTRISQMTKKEMSEFITKCLDWCDDNEVILPPEARFLWLDFMEPPEIEETAQLKLPERDPEYLSHLRHSHCLICGKYGCEAHHVHVDGGLGTTYPDWHGVPLCDDCHRNQFGGHISTEQLKEKTKYLPWDLGVKTILKLMYCRWKKHL